MTDLSPPIDLRAEYLTDPIGLGTPTPRLSWTLPLGDRRGRRQTAYQIVASSSPDSGGDLWDSGRVDSDRSSLVRYDGRALESRRQVWWNVRVWDDNGQPTVYSDSATFEIGLLDNGDWQARWIGVDKRTPAAEPLTDAESSIAVEREGRRYWPAPHLRREFQVRGPIKRARLYATALGLYDAAVNGRRVSSELAPGWTDYAIRRQYQTHDVTALLAPGANALGVVMGDGWYCGFTGFGGKRELYGVDPELLLQLDIDYVDGSREVIGSDDSWRWSYGPILSSDMLEGERVDARLDLGPVSVTQGASSPTGTWQTAGFDDGSWKPVRASTEALGTVPLVAEPDLPIAVTEELTPTSITRLSGGRYLVDLGQNMVGHVRLTARGTAGTTIRLRHVEVLTAEGEPYIVNLRAARQTDEYTLRGDGDEVFEPRFTFHGFRYVEVDGYPGELTPDKITGCVVESRTEVAGTLETGHAMVNQLVKNILWGQRGNFVSVPTDCPQRDERLGWMGDAQVFARTAAYNRQVGPFFTKWLTDVRDAQQADAFFTNVAPTRPCDEPGAPAWADAGVIVPWTIARMYGDLDLLADSYASMARYVDTVTALNPDGIWRNRRNNDFGDWLSIEADTPKEVLGTAYFAYDALLMEKSAAALGKSMDAERYRALFNRVKAAFNKEYVKEDGRIHGDTQTVYLLALHMRLLDAPMQAKAVERLVDDLERRGTLSTGFVGVSYLCPVLTEFGHSDLAYRLLLSEKYPSWGYTIAHGATTIWERWDGWTEHKGFQDPGMNSFNHYCFGSIGEWMYRSVAGIDLDADQPGFKHIVMRPEVSRDLGYAKATYRSPYGTIESYWRFDGGDWLWDVTVPANSTATAYLPSANVDAIRESGAELSVADGVSDLRQDNGRTAITLAPGRYAFRVKI